MTEKTDSVESLRRQVRELLKEKGIYDDWVHGAPHISRVRDNLNVLVEMCPELDASIIEILSKIVEIHDVGRILPGDHAANFAKVFGQIDIKLNKEERKTILFVVENHSKGLPGLGIKIARTYDEEVLGLLVLLDHMDAIGESGFLRPLQWSISSKKYLPILSKISINDLNRFISKEEVTEEIQNLKMKEESILAHLVYNYLATFQIIDPIKHLLSNRFVGELSDRNMYLLDRIDEMMRLQEDSLLS